ncbi:MAG: iron-containing alcohol dehydrogenase [Candidatus Thermoplasmatota archaeon]
MKDVIKDFRFGFPTELEYGVGKIDVLGEKLYDFDKALVVTDKGIEKSGIFDKVNSKLWDLDLQIYSDIESNPKDFQVEKGAEIARDFDPEVIIALGGGSPIDCAKGIGVLVSEGEDDIENYYGSETVKRETLPFIAIPTTAGTGSEVTFSSVITDSDSYLKKSIRSPFIAPDMSILDPELTTSLPEDLTAYTGMDAFTHAVEAYTAKTANPFSNSLALYSMELILKNIEKAVEEPDDLETRGAMLLGSTMGGVAFNNSDVASVHCMAESLGGRYDAPHGLCNSIILPYIMDYNREYCTDKYARVADLMDIEFEDNEEGAKRAVTEIKKLNQNMDMPGIDKIGFKESDIEDLAEMSADNLSNESNPRPMDKEDYEILFEKIS